MSSRNVVFIDGSHLLITTMHPDPVVVMTIDPAEMASIARSRITRGFTEAECATYALNPCPTHDGILAAG